MSTTSSTDSISDAAQAVVAAATSIADSAASAVDSASTAAGDKASLLSESAADVATAAANDNRARWVAVGVLVVVGIAAVAVIMKRRKGDTESEIEND